MKTVLNATSPDVTGDSFDPLDEALVNEERRRLERSLIRKPATDSKRAGDS
jgi:hypothetical protein